jgi:hypothetical protein
MAKRTFAFSLFFSYISLFFPKARYYEKFIIIYLNDRILWS